MPQLSMRKAWPAGFVILSTPYGGMLIAAAADRFQVLDLPVLKAFFGFLHAWIYAGPGIAGFVTAMLAPHEKFLAGVSLAIANAVLAILFNTVLDVFGLGTDFHGLWGAVIVFIATFVFGGIICGLGAFFGAELSEYLENRKRRRQRT